MKKYYIGGAIVIIIGVFIYLFSAGSSTQTATTTTTNDNTTTTDTTPTGNTGGTNPTGGTTATTTGTTGTTGSTGQYKDGTYKGSIADATYGNVQVDAVISGGKITEIDLLQFPNDPGHTTEVSNSSLPVLKQEAIAAQSANVQIVSGATQTSQAFQESLGVALTAAKA